MKTSLHFTTITLKASATGTWQAEYRSPNCNFSDIGGFA
jgi:hypothetical protein